MTLPELHSIPEPLLTNEQWLERERLRYNEWTERLTRHCHSQEVRDFHEKYGRKEGDPIRALSFEDRYRSECDQQNKVERR